MSEENNQQLQELLAKQACLEVIARYCRALDWLDEDALRTVFTPDADIDYGFFKGRGDDFIKAVMEIEHTLLRRWHNCSNTIIQVNRNMAEAETYGFAANVYERDSQKMTDLFGGRYLDRFEQRDGNWRIVKRTYVLDWQQSFPLDAASASVPGLNWLDEASPGHPLYRKL